MYRLETLVCMCVERRSLAIIEAKLTVLQVRRVKPRTGKGFNHRNVVAGLGLRPGLQTLAWAPLTSSRCIWRLRGRRWVEVFPHLIGALFTQI